MKKLHCKQTFSFTESRLCRSLKNRIVIDIKQTLIFITTLVSFNAEQEISRRFENREKREDMTSREQRTQQRDRKMSLEKGNE